MVNNIKIQQLHQILCICFNKTNVKVVLQNNIISLFTKDNRDKLIYVLKIEIDNENELFIDTFFKVKFYLSYNKKEKFVKQIAILKSDVLIKYITSFYKNINDNDFSDNLDSLLLEKEELNKIKHEFIVNDFNPIKDNRIVFNKTFALRLKHLMNLIEDYAKTNPVLMEEVESFSNCADVLLDYQVLTLKDEEEKDYLLRNNVKIKGM